ncbi:hypothetical protein BACCAP_03786 [Pseudoflavonifractor capillosus ATCC 29799]|uniref:Uncharacterized protein n=1 Tax=Pseudoflavonifractor capillosus ATCC 29799 TaxID=411467 RepID=A6NZY2_9FIRM|nr:hypothetical protein BACCAP_03786 [Pseudoflavonifractor capillosus ATCC 29799]
MIVGLQVAAVLAWFEIEDMTLDHMGIPLNFDFPAFLTGESGLIFVLREKQPCFIAGAAIGARTQDGKLDHPAGVILKTLHGENVVSFQLAG